MPYLKKPAPHPTLTLKSQRLTLQLDGLQCDASPIFYSHMLIMDTDNFLFCYILRKPYVMVWLFAVSYELIRGGSQHRIHGLFERALSNDRLRHSVLLWRCYIAYEIDIASNPSAARRVFFRAIHSCPW